MVLTPDADHGSLYGRVIALACHEVFPAGKARVTDGLNVGLQLLLPQLRISSHQSIAAMMRARELDYFGCK